MNCELMDDVQEAEDMAADAGRAVLTLIRSRLIPHAAQGRSERAYAALEEARRSLESLREWLEDDEDDEEEE